MSARLLACGVSALLLASCGDAKPTSGTAPPAPREIIDLGTLITADTPKQFWGARLLRDMKFNDPNSFRVMHWTFGPVSGSNAYYTLFNHGGPHVDAPNHVGVGPGLDAYPIEAFAGPARVIDVSHLSSGRTVTVDMLRKLPINPGDILIIYTGYKAPTTDTALPETIALTYEAAEYLAGIPIRAFGTDALNVESMTSQDPVASDNEIIRTIPGHFAFLSRGIPLYEQLANVEALLDKDNMYFIGVPLNIKDGDGMIVRPVVLVY